MNAAAPAFRELTPALIRGRRGSVVELADGEPAPGLGGTLVHHVFDDGGVRRESTAAITSVPEGVAFAPALVCRDRDRLGNAAPAQLPAERWEQTELESTAFNRRYRLLTLAGQDPIYVREIFSPSLIAWLAHDVPAGFSFELNERHLVVVLPGHLPLGPETERLCGLAAELARRLREEAEEELEGGNLFDETEKLADIEANLGRVRFERPPASAAGAVEAFREAAAWRPTVLARGAFWGIVGFAIAGVPVAFFNPFVAVLTGLAGAAFGFWLGRIMAAADYSWGRASVRRLGLEAFVRGYADSHAMRLEDRWRFHSRHRDLPLPGIADHVLAPRAGEGPLFVILGDAAELRSQGVEVAWASAQPMAAVALVAELPPAALARLDDLEPPSGLQVETSPSAAVVWRRVPGNLALTTRGCDEFRAAAAALIA
ncbi:MAG: hypothetical protein JST59_24800 [Actinobacteria bacterium]|nr:hypothetical protein [Actinomycetota bacterium]